MKRTTASITRRVIAAVLLLEIAAACGLVAAITVNQRQIHYGAFDANLKGLSEVLLGAVQDAEDAGDNVMLDTRGLTLPRDAVYRVSEDDGRVLGSAGAVPALPLIDDAFTQRRIEGRSYRFYVLKGERIIDPGLKGGTHHHVIVVYGQPDGHVWHEVREAVRFFVIATAALLGVTTLVLVWVIRRLLAPVHALASEAEKISVTNWQFEAPASAIRYDELRPLAMAVERTMARLQRSFQQQKRFTSDAAHELKTDLAIVKSSLQLLSMKKRTADEYQRGVSLSLDDLTRLERTVQEMLTLARLEQPLEDGRSTCRLDQVVQDAVQHSQPFAAIREITVNVAAAAPVQVALEGRDAMLLCSNVLVNALQHSPQRGTVEVGFGFDADKVSLTVRDHGEGIREEDRGFLFEPFYRGDPSRSRKSGGTGLGLSICKAICERSGGSIAIANHPGGGAVVTMTLPQPTVRQDAELSSPLKA